MTYVLAIKRRFVELVRITVTAINHMLNPSLVPVDRTSDSSINRS